MTSIYMYLSQLAITLVACFLLSGYLRPHLHRVLVDLCRTEPRARFWGAFANILLIILPIIFGLGYRPQVIGGPGVFFDVARRVQGNLAGFILALLIIGAAVSFFALIAPRPLKNA